MKKWQVVLIVIASVLIILACLFPTFIFEFLFRKPMRSTKVPKSYMETPLYKASVEGVTYMKTTDNVEDMYITSRDGLKLHGFYYPTTKNKPSDGHKKVVIAVHGYKSYSRPQYGPFIDFYHSQGFDMLAVDDRAHAPSEGKYIGFGVLDRLDVTDWAKYLVNLYGPDTEIILHGISMGGATVCAASGEEDLPSQVIGIVSDCGFTSAQEILQFQLKGLNFLLPSLEKKTSKKIGFNFTDHSGIEGVRKAKVPMLFVQGGKDDMVPPYMVHELYDACTSETKNLLFVDEAAHGESICFAKDKYEQAIIDTFNLDK